MKGKKEKSLGRTNEIIGGQDTPRPSKDSVHALLSNFGFNSTRRKDKKGPKFPVNKSGRPCKTVHPVRPRKMAENEVSSEVVVVFP